MKEPKFKLGDEVVVNPDAPGYAALILFCRIHQIQLPETGKVSLVEVCSACGDHFSIVFDELPEYSFDDCNYELIPSTEQLYKDLQP